MREVYKDPLTAAGSETITDKYKGEAGFKPASPFFNADG
ncbi:hypothetical protein GA0116948_10331 [Chitinophaga costaii]|uniref:Uncharacterized protein n=1 Tax=Chitinophaga costaii TaxID=1335309 RepID=A0A1C4BC59_9BACT|nr:hypothetical protein GA0116948_10331 [Chitinophaga costaii]